MTQLVSELPESFRPLPEFDPDALAEVGGMARLFESRTPAVLRGLASNWDFMRTWSPEYLSATMGDFQCTVVHDSRPDLAKEKCSLKDYFQAYSHISTMTIVDTERAVAPDLRVFNDIPIPNACFRREQLSAYFFFHSNIDGGSLPHCHEDAYNLLQRGAKRWVLYDADPVTSPKGHATLAQCLREYGKGSHIRDWFRSGLDSLAQDEFPVYHCIQQAGDVVYIPARYAHAAMNLAETLGVVAVVLRPESPYVRNQDGRYALPGMPSAQP